MRKLKPGDPAPNFSGTLTDGTTVSLGDYRGKKLVMYFYPIDDTPGCIPANLPQTLALARLFNVFCPEWRYHAGVWKSLLNCARPCVA